jgi:hypothetical protein
MPEVQQDPVERLAEQVREYPAGLVTKSNPLREAPNRRPDVWGRMIPALALLPEGWTLERVFPDRPQTLVIYRAGKDGTVRAAAGIGRAGIGRVLVEPLPLRDPRPADHVLAVAVCLAMAAAHIPPSGVVA